MSLFWTIVVVVFVLVILIVSHSIAWLRGFNSGESSAKLDAMNKRMADMKAERG